MAQGNPPGEVRSSEGLGGSREQRANPCKLTECQGLPRCRTCTAMDKAYPAGRVEMGKATINGQTYRRPVMKVAKVTFEGATCVVPLHELGELIDGGDAYTVRVEVMPVREFERLAEFTGW